MQSDTYIFFCSTGKEKKYFYVADKMTWKKAQENCLKSNAILAEPMTVTENSKLQELIVRYNNNKDDNHAGPWIGATDGATDGEWVWADSKQTVSWTDWASIEPNGKTAENCMMFNKNSKSYKTKQYKWNDAKCGDKFDSICQVK